MDTITTSEEFLELFPSSKLNIENQEINSILQKFIIEYNHKLNKSWQTVGKLLKEFFKNNNIELLGRTDNQIVFWKTRGWINPKEKVKEVVSKNLSNTSPEFWKARGYSEEEAKEKAENFYKDKIKGKRVLPTQLEYYTNKGLSTSEAKEALKNEQSKRTMKLVEKEKANPELKKRRLWNQIEYYTNKGYSEKVGYQLMEEKFKERNLQTMKKLTQRYIDKGQDEYTALDSAQKDYKKRAKKIMKTRIENKSFGWQKASKQSLDFFKPLMDYLDKENIEYYVGVEGNTEYFLAKGTEYFYSYDFCIPSKRLIIEYNGEHIHPNPKLTKQEQNKWIHCWTKEDFTTVRNRDLEKIKVAESLGYKVIEVFESDEVKSLDLI
jgi:hypothetical protein